ncbi:MAG: diguanylate cyclase (GGDEF)-like protein [Paraglaciecola sp.]|jgi:diguanylate cyclase (GGDEF)-like protein
MIILRSLLILLITSFVTDSLAVEAYTAQLAKADELRTSNPEQSGVLLNNIDETQLKSNEKELFQYLKAFNFFLNGKVEKANISLNQLAKNSKNIKIQIRVLSTLLSIYATSNDWSNAFKTIDLLNDYPITGLDPIKIDVELIELPVLNFYNNIGEYHLAKKMAISLLDTNISPRASCLTSAELLISQVKTSIGKISAIDFEKASELCITVNENIIKHAINGYFAEYHLALNAPQKAVELLESNISDVKATQYQALIASFYDLLARSHLSTENYPEAEKYSQILLDTEEQHQYQPAITNAYKVLAGINEHYQNYDLAYNYYKKYSLASQIKLDQNNAKLLAIQKAKLDSIEINTQIDILDNENVLLKTQVLLDKESAQNRLLAIGLLTMVLVMFILWSYKNRKTHLKMRYFAQTDDLTGIANRHYFAQLAFSAIELCKKTNQPVSFVIFDLDYFKKINDNHGHLMGDEALKMVVNAAKFACRKNDIIGRLGGEEFGILLPGCGNHLAAHIAEKCRKAIEKIDTSATEHQFTLTASFGVSDSSVCGYEFTTLFAGADRALYQSKDLGRNQVFNYQANSFAFDK